MEGVGGGPGKEGGEEEDGRRTQSPDTYCALMR